MIINFYNQQEMGITEFNRRSGRLFLKDQCLRNPEKRNTLMQHYNDLPDIDLENMVQWANRYIGLKRKGAEIQDYAP